MARWVVCGDALAAVAVSGAAFAQATISGVVDFSAVSNGKTTTGTAADTSVNTTVKTNSTGTQNPWTTSAITFRANEDLGGGLTASATITSAVANGAFAARDTFVTLSGGFGSVQIGRFIPAGSAGQYGFDGARTANTVGSTYGFSGGFPTAPAVSSFFQGSDEFLDKEVTTLERQPNVVQYTSPSFNGLTVAAHFAQNNSDDQTPTTKLGKTKNTQNGLNVAYSAGPLSVAAGMTKRTNSIEGLVGVRADHKDEHNYMGASYNFGAATVFATQAKRKNTNQTGAVAAFNVIDAKITAFGVNVPMGAITLAASTYSGKDKRVGSAARATKLSGNQISVTYALSKRTQIYAVSGTAEIKRDGAASRIIGQKQTATNIGLTHSF